MTSEMVERLRGATRGLCSEDASGYLPRGVSAADCIEAADLIERLTTAIERIHAARLREDGSDEGYGWNITKLNRAMDAALPLIGQPVPPKPDIDVEALRKAISEPYGGSSDNHGS